MAKNGVVTQQELDVATGNYESAKASRDAAAASVAEAKALVSQKDAAVSVARTNLDHTVIRSPIDGIVVARNVDVGQTVAASLQAPTIFTIAQDLTKMQVYAKVDESDVGRIKRGHPASFKVDAFPKDTFRGVVSQIRMNPTTVQNVVTYDAIIDFANPELQLFPGMTAYVTIPVATVEDVVKVPNAALRFKPPMPADAVRALYAKYGLEDGGRHDPAPRCAAAPERGDPGCVAPVSRRRRRRPPGARRPDQLSQGQRVPPGVRRRRLERGDAQLPGHDGRSALHRPREPRRAPGRSLRRPLLGIHRSDADQLDRRLDATRPRARHDPRERL